MGPSGRHRRKGRRGSQLTLIVGVVLVALLALTVTLRLSEHKSFRTVLAAPAMPGSATVHAIAPRPSETIGVSYGTLRWDGSDRRWRMYLPPHAVGARLPLLILLHPAGGAADSFATATSMDTYAGSYGFATVAPEGVDNTWDAGGGCCGAARDKGVDDIGFINAMLNRVSTTRSIDAGQIYVAGASNGGMMAYAVACRLSDRIQAVFSAGGAMTLPDCHPTSPVSVVEFHSLADGLVPFYGGVDPKYEGDLPQFGSTQSTFRTWAAADQCPTRAISDAGPGEQVEVWYGCADGTLLEVWLRITGGGHEWPTSPQAPVDASKTIAKAIASRRLVRRLGPSTDPIGTPTVLRTAA